MLIIESKKENKTLQAKMSSEGQAEFPTVYGTYDEEGEFILAPMKLVIDGKLVFNPTREQYEALGYVKMKNYIKITEDME